MKSLRFAWTLIALSALFVGIAVAERVVRVIDGDTIELEGGIKVRYIGVDTPETVHPQKPVEFMGKEASDFNRSLVEGKDVRLEYDIERTDRYARTLAYVYLDTLFVNAELVRQGFAQILTIPPDVGHADLFLKLQEDARAAGRGLWNTEALRSWESKKPPATEAGTFFITRTGKKYHRAGCRSLAKSAIEITEADALARGYTPCAICIGRTSAVPAAPQTPSIDARSPPASGSAGRCQAITKKGTQCSRMAKPGSRYCWQHGG